MKTLEEITAEIEAFESQFRPEIVPPATPNRKRLQEDLWQAAHKLACLPENIAKRLELHAERKKIMRSTKAKKVAEIRKMDPEHQVRQKLFRELRRLGFERYTTSGRSAYYEHRETGLRVRVSNHHVPMTPERSHNMNNGGSSWSDSQWSHVIGCDDADVFLSKIKDYLSEVTP